MLSDDVEAVDSVMKDGGVWSHKRQSWERIKSKLAEVQKPASNSQRDEIKPCTRLDDCAFVRQEGFCCSTKCKVYSPA